MIRLARGANCGGRTESGLEGLRVKSRRGVPSTPRSAAFTPGAKDEANEPRNIEPTPAVILRRKWRRVCACSNANRVSGEISSGRSAEGKSFFARFLESVIKVTSPERRRD